MAKLRVLAENPPPARGNGENQLRELRDYLTRLKDEIEFLMLHIGEDNLDSDLTERVGSIGNLEKRTAALGKDTEALSREMAKKAEGRIFTLGSGQTLTISTPRGAVYALLVSCAGPNPLNALYYLSGYSDNGTHKQYSTILSSASIAVTAAASGFTVTNNHGSYGMRVGILIAAEDPAGTLGYEVSG